MVRRSTCRHSGDAPSNRGDAPTLAALRGTIWKPMERSHRVRYGLRFGLVPALAVGLVAWSAASAAATGAEVRLEPEEVSARVEDGPFEVTVRVEGINHSFVDRGERSEGLGIYQFSLHFDPEVVAVTDMEPGNFLGSTGRGTSCFAQIRPEDESVF